MIFSRKLLVLLLALSNSGLFALAEVTALQILNAVGSEKVEPLIEEINSLPVETRRATTREVVRLISQEFASGREYHNGKALIAVLPAFADDEILAQALRPYLEYRDESVRSVAFRALSAGRGPATGQVMAEKIRLTFDKLPSPPYKPSDENSARNSLTDSLAFADCLKGLLRSDSNSARDVGARYLALFRNRYSGSIEGQQIIKALEQELGRAGLAIDSAAAPASPEPKAPPTERAAPTPTLPTAAPISSPHPAMPAAQSPLPVVERKSPVWPWGVGILALVVIVALVLKRHT